MKAFSLSGPAGGDASAPSAVLAALRQGLRPVLAAVRGLTCWCRRAWGLLSSGLVPDCVRGLPRAPGYPLVGILPHMCNEGLYSATMAMLFELAAERGLSCSSVGTIPIFYLRDPAIIRQVLVDNAAAVTRFGPDGRGPFAISQRLVGYTAATADGASWHRWRRGLLQSFQGPSALRRAFPDVVRLAERHVRAMVDERAGPDLRRHMEAYALDAVWYVALGVDDMSASSREVADITSEYGDIVGSPSHLWRHVLRNLVCGRPYREPDSVEQAIRRRIDDFLTRLLPQNLARDSRACEDSLLKRLSGPSDGTIMTDDVLAQARQVFSLGHEASTLVLLWGIYELSLHPDVIGRLRSELREHGCIRDHIDFDVLRSLPYMDAVVTELLRLHPPISTTARLVTKPIVIETTDRETVVLPRGSQLFSSLHQLHRDKQVWGETADAFVPERWLGVLPNSAQNRCEYLPFLTGSRACPSSGFVVLQVKTMLAVLLLRVDVHVADPASVEKCFGGVIRPSRPLRYQVCELAI